MITNQSSKSIHPTSIILTPEVQRSCKNEREHLTEFNKDGNANRCSNTVTTTSTGRSSSSGTKESCKLSSYLSTSGMSESQDYSSSGEETRALSWARQAIQDVIDKRISHAAIAPEESALALVRARQQFRQKQQQRILNPPPSANSHSNDESAQFVRHRCSTVSIPSPTFMKEQLSSTKSMVLSHHIDRRGFSKQRDGSNDAPFLKSIVSEVQPSMEDCRNKTTPNTSHSSSPSASLYDINDEIANRSKNASSVDEEPICTKSTIEVRCSVSANIADNITSIDPARQNNASHTTTFVVKKKSIGTVKPSSNQPRQDVNDTKLTNVTNCTPDPTFLMTKPLAADASPTVPQKVTAYIDLVTSTSKLQLTKPQEVKETLVNSTCSKSHMAHSRLDGGLDDTTLATSQSNDVNLDPNMMYHVTSSVRDYIDSMHTNTTKAEIHFSSSVEGRCKLEQLEMLEADTKPHDLQGDSLIEYLLAKASTKNDNNIFGIDPPSTLEDEVIMIDPPLTLTESEVTRSATNEPEINPFKDFTSVDECHNDATTDPDVSNSPILYDKLGERADKFANTRDPGITIDKSIIICEANTESSLYHPCSENVVDAPKRKTTVVTIPSSVFTDNGDEVLTKGTFEPDGLYPSNTARDCVSSLHRLHYLLTGNYDGTEIDVQQLGKLVQYSSLFLDSRLNVTSYGTSQIMTRANELNVSLHITDRFLDAIRSMGDESQTDFDDLENVYLIVLELNAHLEKLTGNNLRVEIEKTETDVSLSMISSIPDDAFEVEVNDGYTNVDFRPSDGEEPWWEVVARLNGTACPDSTSCLHRNIANSDIEETTSLSNIDDSKLTTNLLEHDGIEMQNPVERDIAKFWIEREKIGRQPELSNLPQAGDLIVKKAHSYSGQDITAKCQKSKRISRTRSSSSNFSNISQHSLRSMRRKWASQQLIAKSTEGVPKLNAVSATTAFFDKDNKLRVFNAFSSVWRLSYSERTQHHEGYFNVDKYSLYAASAVQTYRDPLDCVAWESRPVKQRFMYEHSISFSRNWFGCLTEMNLNPVIKEPICRPKSMEMPMEADEWTEEWFLNRHRLRHDRDDNNHEYDGDNLSWEDERPECGTIRNVRLRIGEKITRVTPDLTSHVRRSRWRKKHFPPGTFPYL